MNYPFLLYTVLFLILEIKQKYINSKQHIYVFRNQLLLKPSGFEKWGKWEKGRRSETETNLFVKKKNVNISKSNSNRNEMNRKNRKRTNSKKNSNKKVNHKLSSSVSFTFIYPKEKKKQYEVKNLENIPLYIVTNEFNDIILSFNLEDEKKKEGSEKRNSLNGENDEITKGKLFYKEEEEEEEAEKYFLPEIRETSSLIFPQIIHEKKDKKRESINLNNIQNNNSVSIFFFDIKTAEAYKDDILHLYNKNLKEKKQKTFFGSKIERTTLEKFFQLQKKYKNKIDFVLIPSYNELQNVLKYKNTFYGTPIYYINKIKLQKSFIKKFYYDIFNTNSNNKSKQLVTRKIKIAPGIFLTFSIIVEGETETEKTQINNKKGTKERGIGRINNENHKEKTKEKTKEKKEETKEEKTNRKTKNSYLVIQIETDNKKYVPIFFSYEQANNFYKIFLKHLKSNFTEYCLPKPYIVLDSLENVLTLLKLANEKKHKFSFFNIFFVPDEQQEENSSFQEEFLKMKNGQFNIFHFYIKKILKKINYDFFRAFRKNLNYLLTEYYH